MSIMPRRWRSYHPGSATWYTVVGGPRGPTTLAAGEAMTQSEQGQDKGSGSSTADSSALTYTAWQLFFLERLAWLHKQRRECVNVLSPSDWQMRLLNKALYSTYRDCVDVGVEEGAKLLLAKEQQTN